MKFRLRLLAAILSFVFSVVIINAATAFLFARKSERDLAKTNSSFVNSSDHWEQIGTSYINSIGQTVVLFQPNEFPGIVSNSESLEVVGLAKSANGYKLMLRNNSNKQVVAYCLLLGNQDAEIHGEGYGHRQPLIGAGMTAQEELLQSRFANFDNISIRSVVFDDDSFEGDINLAATIVARRIGIRIQAAPALKMIDDLLTVGEPNLFQAYDELETQLGSMPEAISKPAALELLKSKYPCFDKLMIGTLYEALKQGLYEGKNMAHGPVGNVQRYIKKLRDDSTTSDNALKAKLIRDKLQEIKENFGKVSEVR